MSEPSGIVERVKIVQTVNQKSSRVLFFFFLSGPRKKSLRTQTSRVTMLKKKRKSLPTLLILSWPTGYVALVEVGKRDELKNEEAAIWYYIYSLSRQVKLGDQA